MKKKKSTESKSNTELTSSPIKAEPSAAKTLLREIVDDDYGTGPARPYIIRLARDEKSMICFMLGIALAVCHERKEEKIFHGGLEVVNQVLKQLNEPA